MDFNENFILGCSAIGAGLAVIAGIGPGEQVKVYMQCCSAFW